MPSLRALLAAILPGAIVFAVSVLWLRLPVAVAAGAALFWIAASLVVTRLLYEDADAELAAWQAAAPDLADDP